jgi:hypothetical protein
MRKEYGGVYRRANKFDIREFEDVLDQLSELRQHFLNEFDENGDDAISIAAEDRAWGRALDVYRLHMDQRAAKVGATLGVDIAALGDSLAGALRAKTDRIVSSLELFASGLPGQPSPESEPRPKRRKLKEPITITGDPDIDAEALS